MLGKQPELVGRLQPVADPALDLINTPATGRDVQDEAGGTIIRRQFIAVTVQEHPGYQPGCTLVSVEEWMVFDHTLEERGSQRGKFGIFIVVTLAGPVKRRLQQTNVHDVAVGMLGRGTNNKSVEVDRFLHAHELELLTHGEP
jgi:hypothetical protein